MTTTQIVKIHKTLADKTRFEIFDRIWRHPNISGKELLAEFRITQPTLSFHISKLEAGKLILVKKTGQTHYYSVNVALIEQVVNHGQKCLEINKKQLGKS